MKAPRVRLPLQLGNSSLRALAIASLIVTPGLGLAALTLLFAIAVAVAMPVAGIALFVGGVLLIAFLCRRIALGFRERPSDVSCDEEGLHLHGGRWNGVVLSWELIAEGLLLLDDAGAPTKLFVDDYLLAEAEDDAERNSLRMLYASLRAARQGDSDGPRVNGVRMLTCPGCNAPLAPSAEPRVRCRACGMEVTVAAELRERVRADRELGAAPARAAAVAAALTTQRPARQTSLIFVAGGLVMVAAWPLTIAAAWLSLHAAALTTPLALLLILVPPSLVAGPYLLLRWLIAGRFALRLITVGFGARAPEREGEPHTCRECGAPLVGAPERSDRMLVTCAYCRAENILGIDLRGMAGRYRREAGSLDAALAQRASEVQRWRGRAPWSFPLVAVAALGLWLPLRKVPAQLAHDVPRRPALQPLVPIEQLTGGGDEARPIVSRDGRWLVVEARRSDGTRLVASDRRGLHAPRTIADVDEAPASPSWLVDGKSIVYVSRGNLVARDLDGGAPLLLYPRHALKSISVAGEHAVVRLGSDDAPRIAVVPAPRLAFDGSLAFDDTRLQACAAADRAALSPDGARLAWSWQGSVYVETPSAHRLPRLVAFGSDAAWSPDAHQLAVVQEGLYVVRADGSDRVDLVRGDVRDPFVAAEGDRAWIYFSAASDDGMFVHHAIARTWLDGGEQHDRPAPRPERSLLAGGDDGLRRVTSDCADDRLLDVAGKQLLIARDGHPLLVDPADGSTRSPGDGALYVDGGKTLRLGRRALFSAAELATPRRLADGRHALVARHHAYGWDIVRVDLRSGAVTSVTPGRAVAVSPDGKHLAVVRSDGHHDRVYIVSPDGASFSVGPVGHGDGDVGGVSWSPDGAQLLIAQRLVDRAGNVGSELATVSLELPDDVPSFLAGALLADAHARPLTRSCGDCADPVWARDGSIYFTSSYFGPRNVFRVGN
jgi:Tol biopolymer transport system component